MFVTPQPKRATLALWLIVGFLLATGVVVGSPGRAAAADAYRFWGYFQLTNGTWTFAQKGVDASVPADGSVEGYRYALGDMSTTRMPRATATFDTLCAGTPAQTGKKRVGVVIDFGRTADAREGGNPPAAKTGCAVVDPAATGITVLNAVAATRTEKGLLCAIDSYPSGGACSDTVATVPDAAKAPDTAITLAAPASPSQSAAPAATTNPTAPASSESGTSPLLWIALIVILAAAGTVAARRRRS